MFKEMKNKSYIYNYFTKGHDRSINIKKNILASLIIKGFSIILSLLLVPLTIHYLDKNNYGIWLTISSLVAWMSYFDIGLNNGLRNKFAEAKALNNTELAQKYVSTTYALLILIFIPLTILLIVLNNFLNWSTIFKTTNTMSKDLSTVFIIIISYFSIKFILSTINTLLLADQKPAHASFIGLLEQILSLITIFILTQFTKGSLIKLCLGLCIIPLFMFLFVNIILFSGKYKNVSPNLKSINLSLSKELLGLGIKFFFLQIAVLVQFQTSNIIS